MYFRIIRNFSFALVKKRKKSFDVVNSIPGALASLNVGNDTMEYSEEMILILFWAENLGMSESTARPITSLWEVTGRSMYRIMTDQSKN